MHVQSRLVSCFSLLVIMLLLGSGLGGCSNTTAPLEGTWKTQMGGVDDQNLTWFEFDADRTGDFYGVSNSPTQFIWTRFDDIDQLKAFVARTGVSLRTSVRDGTPLPYSPKGQYLALVDTKASKGFPLIKIISLKQDSMVIELKIDGDDTEVAMERIE